MTINVTSTAFGQNQRIPKKYTGEGDDVSPPLAWTGLPDKTQAVALICDDPDAPTAEPWVHWVIYNLPPTSTGLPEGVPAGRQAQGARRRLAGEELLARRTTSVIGGRCRRRSHGDHHYHFVVYALDQKLPLEPGLTKKEVLKLIEGHILAKGADRDLLEALAMPDRRTHRGPHPEDAELFAPERAAAARAAAGDLCWLLAGAMPPTRP